MYNVLCITYCVSGISIGHQVLLSSVVSLSPSLQSPTSKLDPSILLQDPASYISVTVDAKKGLCRSCLSNNCHGRPAGPWILLCGKGSLTTNRPTLSCQRQNARKSIARLHKPPLSPPRFREGYTHNLSSGELVEFRFPYHFFGSLLLSEISLCS